MSQDELAVRSNVSRTYITLLEIGKRLNPSHDVMEKISNALGMTIPEVFFPSEFISSED